MTWEDRIQEAAYNSPSGQRFVFQFEDVSRSFDKQGTAYSFPDSAGSFVQDLGRTGRKYPIQAIFNGDDYDLLATQFELALAEPGIGALDHPIYGRISVVPLGAINRDDKLKTATNQGTVTVTFFETIDFVFPSVQRDPSATVLSAVDEYNTAKSEEFAELLDVDTELERSALGSRYSALLAQTSTVLEAIAAQEPAANQQFNNIKDSIIDSLFVLLDEPITLALQTQALLQTPAAVAVSEILSRLTAYGSVLTAITSQDAEVPGLDSQPNNNFQNDDLYASTVVTGSIVSVVNTEFETKTEALNAAEKILEQFDELTVWRDDNQVSLELIDPGAAYQQLQEAVAIAAGFLVQISFTLKQERRVTLVRERTIIDLAAQFYGNVDDDTLNFIIDSNALSGSEHIELQRGREFIYYE